MGSSALHLHCIKTDNKYITNSLLTWIGSKCATKASVKSGLNWPQLNPPHSSRTSCIYSNDVNRDCFWVVCIWNLNCNTGKLLPQYESIAINLFIQNYYYNTLNIYMCMYSLRWKGKNLALEVCPKKNW